MLRKINTYLLLNHPLLWNMRIVPVILFTIAIHVAYFCFGYFSNLSVFTLKEYNYKGYNNEEIFLFGGLLQFTGLIIWLIYYLRNNAFKSFYPLKISYLRKEFALIFLIIFLNLPIYHTFIYAHYKKLSKITAHLTPIADADTINMAAGFLPMSLEQFEIQGCCDSINKTDLTPYKEDKSCGYEDSLPIPDYSNEAQAHQAVEPVIIEKKYSYLYYCSTPMNLPQGRINSEYHDIRKRWLINNNRDSIKLCLKAYFRVMDRYKAAYNVNIDKLVDWCFMNPNYEPDYTLSDAYLPYGANSAYDLKYMEGEFRNVETSVNNLIDLRSENFISLSYWLIYFYIALGMSILLLMFRITRLKPWLSAIVGSGIWGILFGLLGFGIGESLTNVILIFILLCVTIAFINIKNKKKKLMGALWLHWFSFSFLTLLPIIAFLIYENTGEIRKCINHVWTIVRPEHPIHSWINQNWDIINYSNLGFGILVVLFVIIPLAFKWQSNPSE